MTSNLLTKEGDISLIFFILQVHIILKFSCILILEFLGFSGKSKICSSLLFFLSSNPFNLSYTLAFASLILSKITVLPFLIALTRKPCLKLKILLDFFFCSQGLVCPIKSEHCKLLVHKHR